MPLGRIAGPPVTPLSLTIPARKSATTCFSAAFSASRRSVRASRSPRDSSERGIFSGTDMLGTNRVRYEQGQPRSSSEGVPEERWISSTFPPNSPRCLRQGQVTEAWLDFLVDMQVGDQGDRSVDHLPGSGNDTGAAAEPVAQAAVRAFESDGLVLAGIMPAR